MPDLGELRGLVDQFPPPAFESLTRVAAGRRRRSAATVLGGAIAATLAVLVVAAGLGGDPRSADPVRPPEPSPTWAKGEWPLERVRAEGHAYDLGLHPEDGSALAVRAWEACPAEKCRGWPGPRDRYVALEVSTDGFRTGDLFRVIESRREPRSSHFARLDEETVFAVDVVRPDSVRSRYRLLDADGTQVRLTMLEGRVPTAPGTDVVRLDSGLFRVDREYATVQELRTPFRFRVDWAPVHQELLWGVGPGCDIVWQDPDGGWDTRPLRCHGATPWLADPMPEGLMVVELHGGRDGISTLISRDRGATWARYGPDVDLDFLTADDY